MPVLANISQSLSNVYQRRFGVRELSSAQQVLAKWFDHSIGQRLLDAEQSALNDLLPEIYGYHLMQLSILEQTRLSMQCPVTHHFSLSPYESEHVQGRAAFEQLPIREESIDAVILHHALEFSTNPHQLLHDAARTIIPNGYVVIVGFNPWGMLQWRKILGRYLFRHNQWRYHRLFRARLIDWLKVLDFDVVYKKNYGFDLPSHFASPAMLEKVIGTVAPFSGNFYVIVGRKTKVPVNMIKAPWKQKKLLQKWVSHPAISRDSISKQPFDSSRKVH